MPQDPYRYFRIEARELLEGLGQGVLELERGATGKDLVARLLRLAHTLKGAARVVKQPGIAELAHAAEDVLAPHREGRGSVARESIDELLRLLDAMNAGLASLDAATEPGPGGPSQSAPEEPFETVRVEIDEVDAILYGVSEAGVQLTGLRQRIEGFGRTQGLALALVEQLSAELGGEQNRTGSRPRAAKVRATAEELRGALGGLERSLSAGLDRAERELAQVRDKANRLRLVPASAVFPALERAARDAALALQKRVAFETIGGENRLDAHVLAALRDGLLHVVRNAVAHGIESEPERLSAGKPPLGRIELHVERRANRVAFVCRDDGRGIDVEAVRRAAVRSGSLPLAEAESLDRDQLLRLILKGGITTTGAVTEVSGRGVGLDVLRETVARLKGKVEVRSEHGRGTTLEICVPVSVSSVTALLVEAGGISAWIPLDAVQRTLRVADGDMARSAEGESILVEGKVIPFVRLATSLYRQASPNGNGRPGSAVIVQAGSAQVAVGVDRLRGTASVVVRPLPSLASAAPVVAGACLDAEGNPQLVLDPGGVLDVERAEGGRTFPAPAPRPPVLVVDDSLTTRMLEQSILESAGYEVELAASAEEALERARERRYSLFVVDIEMPGMDGFEFVERTRADPVLRETPSILVTSLGAAEHRHRGEQVGARAYIVKSEFDQEFLLETIRMLVG